MHNPGVKAWPKFFEYGKRKLNGKSDLYVYFFLHGLKLLHEDGAFAFITSNSWLDVGYGAGLQEFLLRQCRVHFIFDNELKRSFKSADVNTAISILGRGQHDAKETAKFLMWQTPFEDASNALLWQEIESAEKRLHRAEFRLRTLTPKVLLQEGASPDKPEEYAGNKWGGKYLRAPEIYDVILEKGKEKLVRLGDVADVRFGIKTGANEFFCLNEETILEWGIESEYLLPIIKSPRECSKIIVEQSDFRTSLFTCHKEKQSLKGTAALEYIKWGEKEKFHERPSTRSRARWWDAGVRDVPRISANYLIDKVMRFYTNEDGFLVTDVFQEIHVSPKLTWQTAAAANSSILQLSANVAGRANFGDGMLKIQTYEVADLQTINPALLPAAECKSTLLQSAKLNLDGDDRHALDDIIFDALQLSTGERDAMYEAVVNLVEKRLQKAGSLRDKE